MKSAEKQQQNAFATATKRKCTLDATVRQPMLGRFQSGCHSRVAVVAHYGRTNSSGGQGGDSVPDTERGVANI